MILSGTVPWEASGASVDGHMGPLVSARVARGARSYQSGKSAEVIAEGIYQSAGCCVLERRWRSRSGEVDLIVQDGDYIVFVEVKQSRSFAQAALRLGRAQQLRIYRAAEEYLALNDDCADQNVRFDAALVNGIGECRIVENAFEQ